MLNTKGHIGTWLLLVGALVLVMSAWFTFLSFSNDFNDDASAIREASWRAKEDARYIEIILPEITKRAIEKADKNNFIQSFNNSLMKEAEKIGVISGISGNFFAKIKNGEYEIREGQGRYQILLNDIYVGSRIENNEINRTFRLEVNFTKEGLE